MDYRGIYRGAAETDYDQTGKNQHIGFYRSRHKNQSHHDRHDTDTDQTAVSQPVVFKTA